MPRQVIQSAEQKVNQKETSSPSTPEVERRSFEVHNQRELSTLFGNDHHKSTKFSDSFIFIETSEPS